MKVERKDRSEAGLISPCDANSFRRLSRDSYAAARNRQNVSAPLMEAVKTHSPGQIANAGAAVH